MTVVHRHALEQMVARHVGPAELAEVIANPDNSYPSGPEYGRRTVYQRRDLAVVVDEYDMVITVLFKSQEQWASTDGRPSGRVLSNAQRRRLAALLRQPAETFYFDED